MFAYDDHDDDDDDDGDVSKKLQKPLKNTGFYNVFIHWNKIFNIDIKNSTFFINFGGGEFSLR